MIDTLLVRKRILSANMRKAWLKVLYKNRLFYGKKFYFRKRFNLLIEQGGSVKIGKRVFFNNDCSINCVDSIEIGSYTIFGENVKIFDHNHRFNKKNTPVSSQGLSHSKVIIGTNCWIGSNVVILKGAKIGNNCVIGAGCIINETISDDTIVRFNGDQVKEKIIYK